MRVGLEIEGIEGTVFLTLDDGPLGLVLHQVAMRFFVMGMLSRLKTVNAVSCRGLQLLPTDEVLNGSIWREGRELIGGKGKPRLRLQCTWHEAPRAPATTTMARQYRVLHSAEERIPPPLQLVTRHVPASARLLPDKVIDLLRQGTLVLRQAAHQSGDRYCVALSMLLIPGIKLQVYYDQAYYPGHYKRSDKDTLGLMRKRGTEMIKFYEGCGIDPSRISLIKCKDAEQTVRRSKTETFLATSDATRVVATAIELMGFERLRRDIAIPAFTGLVSTSGRRRVMELVDGLMRSCYEGTRPVVMLFLRNTGHQPGGAHPELDTHAPIFRQLIHFLQQLPEPPHIVLVGDRVFKPYNPRKNAQSWKKNVVDMVQWWDKLICTGDERLSLNEQLFGFHYLHQVLGKRLTVMGMRSGMLEAPACMGVQTLYLDYVFPSKARDKVVTSGGFERMLVLSGNPSGGLYRGSGEQAFQGVKIPNYHVMAIHPIGQSQSTSAHGKYLDTLDGLIPLSDKSSIFKGLVGVSPLEIHDQEAKTLLYRQVLKLLRHTSGVGGITLDALGRALFYNPNIPKPKLKSIQAIQEALRGITEVRVDTPSELVELMKLKAYFTTLLEEGQMVLLPTQLLDLASMIYTGTGAPLALTTDMTGGQPKLVLKKN